MATIALTGEVETFGVKTNAANREPEIKPGVTSIRSGL
jgi:hypothetical protein